MQKGEKSVVSEESEEEGAKMREQAQVIVVEYHQAVG
jgi:hypothetical protein